jgi:TRAP-type C4-dicarboxylate transport system permease small subunit
VQKLVILASALIGIFVFGCLVYSGLQLTWFSLTRGDTTANLHLPRALPQSAMVVGALVFCLQIIAALPAELRRIDQASAKEETP